MFILALLLTLSSQTKRDSINLSKLTEIFEPYNQQNQYCKSLFMQLKVKAQNGATIKDLDEHITELAGHMEQDELTNKQLFEVEQNRLEGNILQLQEELKQLEEQNSYLISKLDTLNEQSQSLDVLFSADHEAYVQKIGEQYTLIEAIDELITQINEKQTLQTNDEDLMEKLKIISEDQHIDILAQVTAHLDKEQANKIINLFLQLKDSIKEGIDYDEMNNEQNIKLHSEIRKQIGNLIPETLQQQQDIQKSLEQSKFLLQQNQQDLENLLNDNKNKQEERQQIQASISVAKTLIDQIS